MTSTELTEDNRSQILASLTDDAWVVYCLCAAWCGSCREYRSVFEELALKHPEARWIWIDIEDQADLVGDIDVENFPTLLVQQGELVAFFGEVAPSQQLAERILASQMALSPSQLQSQARTGEERQNWQRECNVRALLRDSVGRQA